jgi:hypothetical protein
VLPSQVVEKERVVVKVLFAEITPRMRQNFRLILSTRISIFDVILKVALVVLTLLLSENESTFFTGLADHLLMLDH